MCAEKTAHAVTREARERMEAEARGLRQRVSDAEAEVGVMRAKAGEALNSQMNSLRAAHAASLEKAAATAAAATAAAAAEAVAGAVAQERARSAEERAGALRDAVKRDEEALSRALAAAREEAAVNVELAVARCGRDAEGAMRRAVAVERASLEGEMGALRAATEARVAAEVADALAAEARRAELVVADRDGIRARLAGEVEARKKLHNQVMELQGNIRVFARVRPVLEVEVRSGDAANVAEIPSETTLVMHEASEAGGGGGSDVFEFDAVFSPTSTQTEVFDKVKPLVASVIDGYNACIFAYGQVRRGGRARSAHPFWIRTHVAH